jgi:hypothetical protein
MLLETSGDFEEFSQQPAKLPIVNNARHATSN